MNAPDRLADLRANPDWAKLRLFDRSKWRRVRFGDVVRVLKEEVDPKSGEVDRYVAGEHMDSEIIHIRRWGTVGDGYLGPAFHRRFRRGHVLYGSRRTYLKKVAVAEWDGVTANTTLVLETAGDRMVQSFLPWLMLSDRFTKHSIAESKGSTNPYINWPDIAKFEFDLPPLDQQKHLSSLLGALDASETTYSELQHDALRTRRIVIDEEVSKAAMEGSLPCSAVMSMQNGRPFPSAHYQREPGIRLIRPGNLGIDGYLNWNAGATVYLPTSYGDANEDWHIGPNQVLINLTAQSLDDGFMGRVCYTRSEDAGLLNQRIGRFLIRDGFLPEFIFRCLQTTQFRSLVESRCEGSKVRHIYFRHFEKYPIPNAALHKQRAICERVNSVEIATTDIDEARKRCVALRSTLLGELF